ncbi:MAG: 4-hydroxy-3-methylbut-2-enyl diphosphate reductase, partial [Pelagibacterales bacterium]|nr:4-hydroxy-3-methylbut-2-enyl diphosphate reductase [Pelagibacterales bacterium]
LGRDVVLIGHDGHPEIEGTMGQYKSKTGHIYIVETIDDIDNLVINNNDLAYVTQTTLSIDDTEQIIKRLIKRFPNIKAPIKDDICYATQNRQDAVKSILKFCDSLIVIGSENSSNSRRLTELAAKNNIPSYLIDNKGDIDLNNFKDRKVIGITAGASAPEILINEVIEFLVSKGAELGSYNQSATKEDIVFTIPKELR